MQRAWGRWAAVGVLFATSVAACAGDGDEVVLPDGAEEETACDTASVGVRQLRLLTRAEYEATVRDLFGDAVDWTGGATTAPSCGGDADCDIASASCVAGVCQADPCAVHTFVLPANGASWGKVHVAGSFNGWPATAASGGWAMSYVASLDAWVTKHSVADGTHTYKFVIDETSWVTDPENPNGEPDGFGGENSLLSMACAGADPPPTPSTEPLAVTDGFPVESRPPRFPFDNAAASGLVTATHVERYLRAAEALVARAELEGLTGCALATPSADCLRDFVTGFGERAFRRPLEADHVAEYLALIDGQDDPRRGVEVALRVMLSSPMFLYRQEIGVADGDVARLDGWELASTLSYFFWGTMPDALLFEAARSGALDTPEGVEREARRLVASERARARLEAFAAQWLGVEGVASATKSELLFPTFDAALGAAMLAETRAFVSHVVFDRSGSYRELLLGDSTIATGALASLYEAEDGQLPAHRHAGVLAHGSVLASYSHSDQTSPIRRGVFVRERILCEELPAPPPDAASIPEIAEGLSTRERFAQHSSDPACKVCHRMIDGVGFAFEHFDAIGRYRATENGAPIDASGEIAGLDGDNRMHDGLVELAQLLADSREAPACFATNAYRFALGTLETESMACDLELLAQRFTERELDVKELLVAVTQLESFRTRRAP